ncbi:uncharacterized protein N7482_007887 [Penicillium canariense]|uniref:NACHT-NTPase and P-loop NTPases N-terminal domain-containing protein n=1 Tax=Penicillium canariense TaxID=189055 RepID=A0A9W9HXR1_9EURO|nr:uncharacterized protein N7482_007887 [Penicillium canariense]KAJ5160883.1 hypothetical protein N7482_007887 [Penicillium canariense]
MSTGLEIISLINGSIEIILLIKQIYDTIKTFDGLPKAFDEVNEQLPLVHDSLTRAKGGVSQLDTTAKTSVEKMLQQCEKKARELLTIFEALKQAQGHSIKNIYTRVVLTIGKRGRVEDLMKDILSNIQKLSQNKVFQLADQVDNLQRALDRLSQVVPSIADSEMESMFGSTGPQQIGDNNVQNWAAGDGDAFHVTGGTVNKGETFSQTNHYGK